MIRNELVDIPGYTVHRLLGKGGVAAVYLATPVDQEQEVAIKVLLKPGNEQHNQRFVHEARLLSTLDHTRVIKVFEVAQLADGRDYIVMEYLSGGDLARLKTQMLGPMYALELIRQIAEGLSVVHRKGIIHRDIKPANILFRANGNAVLTDFGIAHQHSGSEPAQAHLHCTGSPAYGSPEQFCGAAADQCTDIYSLGVVLLELMLGHNPFKGDDCEKTVRNHALMPLPELPPTLRQYQPLFQRMLAKNPADRFASADDLLTVIVDHVHGNSSALDQSITRQYFSPSVPLDGGPSRRKMLLATVFALVLTAIGASVFYYTYPTANDRQISELLVLGKQRLQEGNLIEPEFDNARYYFTAVLKMDPVNNDALMGQEEIRQQQVNHFLTLASTQMEQLKLTRPANDNAFFYFQRALLLDPENVAAKLGLNQIVQLYLGMAQKAFGNSEFDTGLGYVVAGLEVDPANADLLLMREQHKNQATLIARLYRKIFN